MVYNAFRHYTPLTLGNFKKKNFWICTSNEHCCNVKLFYRTAVRRGSVAIVPLFLAIALLFWFIWFLGGANDNLHKVNQIEYLQHTQDRLLQAAIQKRYELEEADPTLSDAELDAAVNKYIQEIMKINKIDKNGGK